MTRQATTIVLATALATLAGCSEGNVGANTAEVSPTAMPTTNAASSEMAPPAGATATAELKTADGKAVGRAVASEADGGIQLALDVSGMPPGVHGAHVHTTGKCEAPKFESAGPHWNPTGKQHGSENPQGPHAGDFPNLTVNADGTGTLAIALPAGTLAGMLDADGAAFVVHAKADDNKTDPSGNSGDRIACGVFTRG